MTSVIECPATPDRIDQCPATPELLPIKSPASTSASSDNDENDPTRSTTSPPPNCAICLGKCKNKCFTDSCLHQFCFKCLLEWSKVKAECPLCKQSFKSIIHNVKSIDQFEEYLVQQPIQIENLYPSSRILQYHSHHSTTGPRNNRGFSATVEIHNNNMNLINRAEVLDRFRQRFPENMVSNSSLSQVWRRYIYDRHLYALPLPDLTGRFRECSARFYRENTAQVIRIMPWLNRDLVTLLRNTEQHVSLVLSTIGDLITIFNISSAEFRRRVTPYFGNNTSHFIHELLNFARSPFDMIGYDRAVQYTQYYEAIIVSTSSDDSDSEVVTISQVAGRLFSRGRSSLGFTIETNERDSTLRIRLANGSNNTSNASTSQTTAINLTTNNNSNNHNNGVNNNTNNSNNDGMTAGSSNSITSGNSNNNSNQLSGHPQVLGETQIIDIEQSSTSSGINAFDSNNIELPINTVSSSSDECEFILEQKPPHLRTPELVSLNSDSDSDVVFVSEVKIPQQQQNENNRPKKNLQKGIFLPSSDINHSSDSDVTIKFNNADKLKLMQPSSSSNQVPHNLKHEYNHGASTSSGLRSRTNKSNHLPISSSNKLMKVHNFALDKKKNNQEPPLRTILRRFPLSGVKTIYESSSSSADDDDDDESNKDDSERTSSCNNSDISHWNINKMKKENEGNNNHTKKRRRHMSENYLLMKRNLRKRHSTKRKRNNNNDDDKSGYGENQNMKKNTKKLSWKNFIKSPNKERKKSTKTNTTKSVTKSTVSKSKKRKVSVSSSSSSTSSSSSQSESANTTFTSSSSSSSDSTGFSDSDMEPLIRIGCDNKKTQTTTVITDNLTNSSSVLSINTNVSSNSSNTTTTISTTSSNPITTVAPPLIFSNRTNEVPNNEFNTSDEEYNFSLTLDENCNCESDKDDSYEFAYSLDDIGTYSVSDVHTIPTNMISTTTTTTTTTLNQQPENDNTST